jgi:tetratricopeptide (TPR) repeat protein
MFRLLAREAIFEESHVTKSGNASVQTRGGSFEEGLANGQKLLAQHPGVALQQAQTLLRSGPEPRALQLAAAALRRLGKHDEAEQAELSAIKASFAIRELDAAAVAGNEGRAADSRAMLEGFLLRHPDNLLALTMAAELDIDAWHLERAEQRLGAVLERAPKFLRAIMLFAKCLTNQGRLREAIRIVEGVLSRKPDNLTVLRNLGQLHAEANDHEGAVKIYRRVLELDPRELEMWIVYAQHSRMLGRKNEATAAFRRAIALNPNSGAAWWGLANFFPSDISEADVEAMEHAVPSVADNPDDGGALHIALGTVADRRADHAGAFRHIAQGKKLRARGHPSDPSAESAKIDELIRAFSPQRFADRGNGGHPDDSPIFIIGMPRSGTTLLERILNRHSLIEAAGELPIMPRLDERLRHESGRSYEDRIASLSAQELTTLGANYVGRSQDYRTSDKPRFVDKLNYNWSRVGLIRLMLPNARIIDLRRDALDCCWSNFKMMFAEGHAASNDQRSIARFYRDYVRLVDAVDAAAPGGIFKVRYEELVDDVEAQTRRILGFLGLEFEAACLDFHLSTEAVATPSSEQVRRPINRDSIGSAEPYRQWLGPMIEELGELADA